MNDLPLAFKYALHHTDLQMGMCVWGRHVGIVRRVSLMRHDGLRSTESWMCMFHVEQLLRARYGGPIGKETTQDG